MSDDYIRKIGLATENEAKLGLFQFLQLEYSKQPSFNGEIPEALAAAVTDHVFGEEPGDNPTGDFARDNAELVSTHAREIGKQNDLCTLLSGAAYNTCYARYLNAGGKRSMFSNPFLGYVRAGRDLSIRSNREIHVNLYSQIFQLGAHVLRPMDSMQSLHILRPLPYSPNEQDFYYAVHQFALRLGVEFERQVRR